MRRRFWERSTSLNWRARSAISAKALGSFKLTEQLSKDSSVAEGATGLLCLECSVGTVVCTSSQSTKISNMSSTSWPVAKSSGVLRLAVKGDNTPRPSPSGRLSLDSGSLPARRLPSGAAIRCDSSVLSSGACSRLVSALGVNMPSESIPRCNCSIRSSTGECGCSSRHANVYAESSLDSAKAGSIATARPSSTFSELERSPADLSD
mmetsp:Transcript_52535/g.112362  ORF Transcript_52535/g.112362 Transcript_52535/m.112362 type:complete len:207 (+) Transcript_52535:454-1074(+)